MFHDHEMFEKGLRAFFDGVGLEECPPISFKHDGSSNWLEGYRFGQNFTLASKLSKAQNGDVAADQPGDGPSDQEA